MSKIVLAILCSDDRCWKPSVRHLEEEYERVFLFPRPGANKILGCSFDTLRTKALKMDLEDVIGLENLKGKEVDIVVGGHFECAKNRTGKGEQIQHLLNSKSIIESFGLGQKRVILLWVNEEGIVEMHPEKSIVFSYVAS